MAVLKKNSPAFREENKNGGRIFSRPPYHIKKIFCPAGANLDLLARHTALFFEKSLPDDIACTVVVTEPRLPFDLDSRDPA
jgi:hypothetical protein